MASLFLRNIGKNYRGGAQAVRNFNLEIDDNDFIALVGPTGCGKTALLRMIAGLDDITAGEILIDDKPVNLIPARQRDVQLVDKNAKFNRFFRLRCGMAKGLAGTKAEIAARVQEAAAMLGIEDLLDRKPRTLTGAQLVRAALARAIASRPKVILLDDTLSILAPEEKAQARTELCDLHRRLSTTFIYATRDQADAMMMGTRVVVMHEGAIQQEDTPQNLYDYPANLFVAKYIGAPGMNIFRVKLAKHADGIFAEFGDNAIRVPTGKIQRMTGDYIGKEVYMGIHPENLHDESAFLSAYPESALEVRVKTVERMGASTYLHINAPGWDESFIACVDPRTNCREGDQIPIGFDVNRLHFFDASSEKTILSRD